MRNMAERYFTSRHEYMWSVSSTQVRSVLSHGLQKNRRLFALQRRQRAYRSWTTSCSHLFFSKLRLPLCALSHLQGFVQVHVEVGIVVQRQLRVLCHGHGLSDLVCGALLVILRSHEEDRRLNLHERRATSPIGGGRVQNQRENQNRSVKSTLRRQLPLEFPSK